MQVLERQTGARREERNMCNPWQNRKRCHSPSQYKTHVTESQTGSGSHRRRKASPSQSGLMSLLVWPRNNKHSLKTCYWASATAPGFKGLPSIREKLREERRNAEFFTRITTLHRCNWQHQYEVPSTDSSISILGLTFTFKCQQAQFNYMCVYSYQERLTLW